MPTIAGPVQVAATIANGQTVGAEFDLAGNAIVGMILPAGMDSTSMTFQAAETAGGTFVAVNDDEGNVVSITVASSKQIAFSPAITTKLLGLRFGKLVAGTAETPAKTIILLTRPVT